MNPRVAAEPGEVAAAAQHEAAVRIDRAVAIIERQRLAKLRQVGRAGQVLDVEAGRRGDVVDVPIDQRVGPGLAQVLVEIVAGAQRQAGSPLAVFRDHLIVVVGMEDVETGDDVAIEEIRIGHRQIDRAFPLREDPVDAGVDARADHVLLVQAEIEQRADVGGVAAADVQFAGRLLVDVGRDHRFVRRRAGRGVHCHGVEVAEILQALAGAADQRGVERIAFGHAEFAADHLVLGAGVADDVDAFDIDARPLAHVEHQIDGVLGLVARDARLDLDEREARGSARRRSSPARCARRRRRHTSRRGRYRAAAAAWRCPACAASNSPSTLPTR